MIMILGMYFDNVCVYHHLSKIDEYMIGNSVYRRFKLYIGCPWTVIYD